MARYLPLGFALLLPAVAVAAPPAVTAVAYHPQGKSIAFGLHDGVRLFDPQKGEPAGASPVAPGRVTALAFDPRGHWLAVAHGEPGKPGEVRLFRLNDEGRAEKTHLVTITGHK